MNFSSFFRLFFSVLFLTAVFSCRPKYDDRPAVLTPSGMIDPLIGTQAATTPSAMRHSTGESELRGQTIPAVGLPHGMTQWTPQTQATETKCLPPYRYEDKLIQGFRATHWMSGSCTQDYGSMTIAPQSGKLITGATERASGFYRDEEIATPWSYSVILNKYNIAVELSATERCGIMRLRFNSYNKTPHILIEPNSDEGRGWVKIDKKRNMVYGYNPVHRIYQGWGEYAGFNGWFAVQFSEPINSYGTWENGKITFGSDEAGGDSSHVGAFAGFDFIQALTVKVGTSFTSLEGAIANLEAEIPGWDYGLIKERAEESWEKVINKIEVEGGSGEQKKMFYTALYHAYQLPRTFSDAGGRYPGFDGDTLVRQADGHEYFDDFSLWDTYRALHPLMTILEPGKTNEMIKSLILKAQQGGWLPIFPAWNNYTAAMIGDHAIAMIGDAYVKGIRGFDADTAWKYMRKNAFVFNADTASYREGKGRRALDSYLKYGYIPMEDKVFDAFHKNEQASRTLEYAYDDFVLHRFAKATGHGQDANILKRRARNWQNVFDPSTGYVRGRYAGGQWFEPFDPGDIRAPYITEGTPAQYTWYVPHDVYGLMKAMDGRQKFIARLDSLFATGQYWHGNEPGHHTAYLYAWAGQPWKTQQLVKKIIAEEYGATPGGLSGNEDAGQMSAWLVFSMIGFYPVCPGTPYYIIGAPSFREVAVNLENGKKFMIRADNLSNDNIFIQSATLNGRPFNRAWLHHEEIVNGGELIFEMGPEPDKQWAFGAESLPPDPLREKPVKK